jgi:hypothetical protein
MVAGPFLLGIYSRPHLITTNYQLAQKALPLTGHGKDIGYAQNTTEVPEAVNNRAKG